MTELQIFDSLMSQPGYPTHPLSVPLHYKSVVLLQDLPSPASNLGPCRWFRHCSGLLVSVLSLRHHCDCSVATDRLVSHWCSGWGACQRKATTGRIYHQHWATIQYSPSLSVSMSSVSMSTERSTLFSRCTVVLLTLSQGEWLVLRRLSLM